MAKHSFFKHATTPTTIATTPPPPPTTTTNHRLPTIASRRGMKSFLQRGHRCPSKILSVWKSSTPRRVIPNDGQQLSDFIHKRPTIVDQEFPPGGKFFHLKTYGCQMNVNDSDIVRAVLLADGWQESTEESADLLLTNTCAIREGAERKVWQRLKFLRKQNKIVGVLGCMAERLSTELLKDGLADLVIGPDAYRDVAVLANRLIEEEDATLQLYNTQLSLDETYADITPIRANSSSVSAFLSIQRGCANRCSFCIVPFTRGQERSKPFTSILDEVRSLVDQGVKEVTLLGQNVNSYHDRSEEALLARPTASYTMSNDGFRSRIRRKEGGYHFADLLAAISDVSPELRVRFTSPHPKDYPPALLDLMAERPNICNHIHMPAQSGSTTMLKRMKRGYTREAYLELIENIHATIPDVAVSTDMIAGFCGETDEEHEDSVSLMNLVRYDQAFMFAYSSREKTYAERHMEDNVPPEVKNTRLRELIATFQHQVHQKNEEQEVGRLRLVLLEGESKRSSPENRQWTGRTDQNKRLVMAPIMGSSDESDSPLKVINESSMTSILSHFCDHKEPPTVNGIQWTEVKAGDYVVCRVTEAKGHTLRGKALWASSIQSFSQFDSSGSSLYQQAYDWLDSTNSTKKQRPVEPIFLNA